MTLVAPTLYAIHMERRLEKRLSLIEKLPIPEEEKRILRREANLKMWLMVLWPVPACWIFLGLHFTFDWFLPVVGGLLVVAAVGMYLRVRTRTKKETGENL